VVRAGGLLSIDSCARQLDSFGYVFFGAWRKASFLFLFISLGLRRIFGHCAIVDLQPVWERERALAQRLVQRCSFAASAEQNIFAGWAGVLRARSGILSSPFARRGWKKQRNLLSTFVPAQPQQRPKPRPRRRLLHQPSLHFSQPLEDHGRAGATAHSFAWMQSTLTRRVSPFPSSAAR